MEIRFLAQSAVMITDGDARILVDPFITGNPKATIQADELDQTHILLTHGHLDHAAGAAAFAAMTGAPVLAADPAHRLGGEGLAPSDTVTADGCELRVVRTPGHTADSVSLLLPADGALLTGDTVLGRGTTVIAYDGNLADYLRSLDRLRALADEAGLRVLLPGHGPLLADPAGTLDYYLAHRRERLAEITAALAAGDRTPAEIVARVAREAMAETVKQAGKARETAVQAKVRQRLEAGGLVMPEPPIVGFGPNAANPHYEPREGADRLLESNQVVLIDLWGRTRDDTTFADQTWMGFAGGTVPSEVVKVWETVRDARDAAVAFVKQAVAEGRQLEGWEVDRACRSVIERAGYGRWFTHRTGHNIGQEVHGNGANMDDLEMHDTRRVIPQTCFSVEPGIYLKRYGIRSEVDVYVDERRARVTGAVQTDRSAMFAPGAGKGRAR